MNEVNEKVLTHVVVESEANGKITFANDVIATIAGLAAIEVEGLAGMSGGIVGGIVEFLGKKNFTKGVKVETGNEEASVELYVIVEYGQKIHEVCKSIQANVKKAIETMTGLKVVSVNVFVQGVNVEKEKKAEEQAEVETTPKLK